MLVLSTNSRCELKITGFGGCRGLGAVGTAAAHDAHGAVVSSFVGTLRPGTPGPAWAGHGLPYSGNGRRTEEERRSIRVSLTSEPHASDAPASSVAKPLSETAREG